MLYAQSKGLTTSHARTHTSGFAVTSVFAASAAILIVFVFAASWLKAGRSSLSLSNSAQQFAEHVERARADSIRRRATSGSEASVEVLNATTYRLKMGFGGSSTLSTRDFTLEGDTVFVTSPTTVSFDARGRLTTGTETSFAFKNSSGSTKVEVTGAGDVTVSNSLPELPAERSTRLLVQHSNSLDPEPNRIASMSKLDLLLGCRSIKDTI